MTHGIRTWNGGGTLSYLQRVGRTLFAPDVDPGTRLERLLDQETTEFGVAYGFLSRVDLEAETQRIEVFHGSHERLRAGATIPLSRSYCRDTLASPEGTLAISDAVEEGRGDDPAYEAFGLGSYLGTTVTVGDELYGTLCFADTAACAEPFVEGEKALVETFAQWVGYLLAPEVDASLGGTRLDAVEGRSVSSDGIDSMMGMLSSPPRRDVLAALLADAELDVATLERRLRNRPDRTLLYHSYLPKLADAGYVSWDRDANTVARGPRFGEVRPLVQLLDEYETDAPE